MIRLCVQRIPTFRNLDPVTIANYSQCTLEKRRRSNRPNLGGCVDGEVELVIDQIPRVRGQEAEDSRIGASSKRDDLFFAIPVLRRRGWFLGEESVDELVDCGGADVCACFDGVFMALVGL